MPNQTIKQKVFIPLARKAVGQAQYYGVANYGLAYYGQDDEVYAVYQKRYTSHTSARSYGTGYYGTLFYGEQTGFPPRARNGKIRSGMRHISMKFYRPTNPQTVLQQGNRTVFRQGVEAWQSLTQGEKDLYNKRAIGLHMTGYHLHLREWLLANL